MPVEINEVASTVRTVDGDNLLDPRTLQRIVQLVMQALDDRELHEKRAAAERGVPRGVTRQQERGD
jgi:hypothetical protein